MANGSLCVHDPDSISNIVLGTKRSQEVDVGQLAYAPATQTRTVVTTTTTTTTTNFPPLIMRAPQNVENFDPRLYPLANSPTPASLKKFHFSIGDDRVWFQEATDGNRVLREVKYALYRIQRI